MADRYDDPARDRERERDWNFERNRGSRQEFGQGREYDRDRDDDRERFDWTDRERSMGESQYGGGRRAEGLRGRHVREYDDRPGLRSGSWTSGAYGQSGFGGGSYGHADIGTAGQGGYGERAYGQGSYAPQIGRFTGRGPKGYQRSDERIREDVCERLTEHPDIDASEIDIQVSSGEVTLAGSVDDRRQKRAAEEVVENLTGVREVHNNLRVSQGTQRFGDSSEANRDVLQSRRATNSGL